MIQFPSEFVKTRYSGYVWNTEEERLYTIKGGYLRPMKVSKPWYDRNRGFKWPERYCVSVNGRQTSMSVESLKKLKPKTLEYMWQEPSDFYQHEYPREYTDMLDKFPSVVDMWGGHKCSFAPPEISTIFTTIKGLMQQTNSIPAEQGLIFYWNSNLDKIDKLAVTNEKFKSNI